MQNATTEYHETKTHRSVSYSEIQEWMVCRHRWFLHYALKIQPRQVSRPLTLGDVVHRAIAASLSGIGKPYEVVDEYIREISALSASDNDYELNSYLRDLRDDAFAVIDRALGEISDLGWETMYIEPSNEHPIEITVEPGEKFQLGPIPAVELELETPIAGFDRFVGHLDWIAHDKSTDRNILVDFKVRKSFSPLSYEEVNLQHITYLKLARNNGIRIDTTATFEIKADAPKKPKLNKDRTMSRSAIATDWSTYKGALIEAGINPAYYEDMREKLEQNRFSNVMTCFRSDNEVDNAWERIIEPAAREIAICYGLLEEGFQSAHIWRAMRHMTCNGCSVREPCLAGMRGHDVIGTLHGFEYNEERVAYAVGKGWT